MNSWKMCVHNVSKMIVSILAEWTKKLGQHFQVLEKSRLVAMLLNPNDAASLGF